MLYVFKYYVFLPIRHFLQKIINKNYQNCAFLSFTGKMATYFYKGKGGRGRAGWPVEGCLTLCSDMTYLSPAVTPSRLYPQRYGSYRPRTYEPCEATARISYAGRQPYYLYYFYITAESCFVRIYDKSLSQDLQQSNVRYILESCGEMGYAPSALQKRWIILHKLD